MYEQCCAYAAGGDLYEDLRRRGGKYEEAVTSAGVLKPCIEALMYLHSKVRTPLAGLQTLLRRCGRACSMSISMLVHATCL